MSYERCLHRNKKIHQLGLNNIQSRNWTYLSTDRLISTFKKKNIQEKIHVGKIEYEPELSVLHLEGGVKKLTTKENMLLRLLVQNQNELLDRQAALRAVWGDDNYFNGRSMDVYIAKLRKLLKEDSNIEIMNVHGIGFKLLVKQ